MNELSIEVIKKEGITVHVLGSPVLGEKVNSILVESENMLVAIDVPLLKNYSAELKDYIEKLGKPLERVIVTHAHPDHWATLEDFKEVPIYSLPETQKEIREKGDWVLGFHRTSHGDLVAKEAFVPTHRIEEGHLVVDSVTYNIMKIVDAEANYLLAIDIPRIKTLIAQDMIYNKVFLFLGDKTSKGELCCRSWAMELEKLKKTHYDIVIPGHGKVTDASIFDQNIEYLKKAETIIMASKTGPEYKSRMMKSFPKYEVPLTLDMTAYFLYGQ